jgi:hypothetical protein
VHVEELGHESILVMDISRPSPLHHKVADVFVNCNAPLNLTLKNAPIETIKKMVAIGLEIGFVPLISVRQEISQGKLSVVSVYGSDRSARTKSLLEFQFPMIPARCGLGKRCGSARWFHREPGDEADQLALARGICFGVNAGQLRLQGIGADVQQLGDLPSGFSVTDQQGHTVFGGSQTEHRLQNILARADPLFRVMDENQCAYRAGCFDS